LSESVLSFARIDELAAAAPALPNGIQGGLIADRPLFAATAGLQTKTSKVSRLCADKTL
jgi:hypothetical protein